MTHEAELCALGHGHHEGLISWGRELGERLAQVRAVKAESEWTVRERCMWQITPEQFAELPPAVVEARLAYFKAVRAWNSLDLPTEYESEAWNKAREACISKGWAHREAEEAHHAELEAWHAKHCPALQTPEGCPWDGKRLVGVGEDL